MANPFRPTGISIKIREDLVEGSSRTQTTLICDPIITKDGHRVSMSDIGDICFATLDQGTSNEEIISFTGITDNTTTYTLTGCVWGYNFYNTTSGVSANMKRHISGGGFIITNPDHFLSQQYVSVDGDQTVAGVKTFSSTPKSTAGDPLVGTDLVIKSYVDALVLGTLTTINVIVPGKAGETVAAGQLIYFDLTDNEWKLTDADTAATVENVLLGIAQGAGTNGNAITGGVLLQGVDDNQSGLTEGDVYYAGNTAGAIANSAGTVEITVGLGKSATELYFNPRFNQQITEDQQDALAGTSGTPSGTNKFVTNDDTATAATADKVARRLAGGNITVVTETASNNSTNAASTAYVDAADAIVNARISNNYLGVGVAEAKSYIQSQMLFEWTGAGTIANFSRASMPDSQLKGHYYLPVQGSSDSNHQIYSTNGIGTLYNGNNIQWDSNKDIILEFNLSMSGNSGSEQAGWGLASGANLTNTTYDYDYAGASAAMFTYNTDGKLYAKTSNGGGTTNHTETEITGVTLGAWNLYRIVINPGVDVKFYVNGVLKATITTTLPTGTEDIQFIVGATGNANQPSMITAPAFAIER